MVVRCLIGCRCCIDLLKEEFREGKLYRVIEENNSNFIIGDLGNKFPIIGFWRIFKVVRSNKRGRLK
jgi:hypothetical protein